MNLFLYSAAGENRTLTTLRSLVFETSAYTSSATAAYLLFINRPGKPARMPIPPSRLLLRSACKCIGEAGPLQQNNVVLKIYFFASKKALNISIGKGNTIVDDFSVDISTRVCRYLICNDIGSLDSVWAAAVSFSAA